MFYCVDHQFFNLINVCEYYAYLFFLYLVYVCLVTVVLFLHAHSLIGSPLSTRLQSIAAHFLNCRFFYFGILFFTL